MKLEKEGEIITIIIRRNIKFIEKKIKKKETNKLENTIKSIKKKLIEEEASNERERKKCRLRNKYFFIVFFFKLC